MSTIERLLFKFEKWKQCGGLFCCVTIPVLFQVSRCIVWHHAQPQNMLWSPGSSRPSHLFLSTPLMPISSSSLSLSSVLTSFAKGKIYCAKHIPKPKKTDVVDMNILLSQKVARYWQTSSQFPQLQVWESLPNTEHCAEKEDVWWIPPGRLPLTRVHALAVLYSQIPRNPITSANPLWFFAPLCWQCTSVVSLLPAPAHLSCDDAWSLDAAHVFHMHTGCRARNEGQGSRCLSLSFSPSLPPSLSLSRFLCSSRRMRSAREY